MMVELILTGAAGVAMALGTFVGGYIRGRGERRPRAAAPPKDFDQLPDLSSIEETSPGKRRRGLRDYDRDAVILEILDVVTQHYRQLAEQSSEKARDAIARETIARQAEILDAIDARVRRLMTRAEALDHHRNVEERIQGVEAEIERLRVSVQATMARDREVDSGS